MFFKKKSQNRLKKRKRMSNIALYIDLLVVINKY